MILKSLKKYKDKHVDTTLRTPVQNKNVLYKKNQKSNELTVGKVYERKKSGWPRTIKTNKMCKKIFKKKCRKWIKM